MNARAPKHRGRIIEWMLSAALLGIAPACSRPEESTARGPKPPQLVVLVSLDTLRADRVGCYGYERPTTPHLDALAADGVVFANAGAQATQTLISHKSLLTSKYPLRLLSEVSRAGMQKLASVRDPRRFLIGSFRNVKSGSLLSALQDGGYATAAFTDGAWMSRSMHFDQGFAEFDDRGGHFEEILPRVLDWLARRPDGRAFLFVHTYDTHCPYACREPYNSLFCKDHSKHVSLEERCGQVVGDPPLMEMDLGDADLRAISDHYDGGVASADAYVGELLARLRDLGLYDDALILVTSDHGESLGSHGQIGHGGFYLEQLLVPLIVKLPVSWAVSPRVIQPPVELVDVMPTIHDACGLGAPKGVDGRSLLPLILGDEWERTRIVAQIAFREGRAGTSSAVKRAILDPGQWLLIHDGGTQSMELFDLSVDKQGLTDVAARNASVIPRLMDALAALDPGGQPGDLVETGAVEIDERLRRQLESLGYAGD